MIKVKCFWHNWISIYRVIIIAILTSFSFNEHLLSDFDHNSIKNVVEDTKTEYKQ